MIAAGIDCGAKNTKTVIMKDGGIVGKGMVSTGFDQEKAVADSLDTAVKEALIARDNVDKIFGTGSGKNAIKMADVKKQQPEVRNQKERDGDRNQETKSRSQKIRIGIINFLYLLL